jgi:hypothetical protein
VYYLNGGLELGPLSQVRPSTQVGEGIGGTMFYLTATAATMPNCSGQRGLVCTGSNSGSRSVDPYNTSGLTCSGGPPPDVRLGLPATLDGNVLLAPCSGTYGGDSLGHSHGILFFGDRDSNGGGGWGGQGAYALAGTIYIHQCSSTDGADLGTHCAAPNTGYNATFQLQGGSGSTSYVLGEIITDSLSLGGNSVIKMALNPNATRDILKVALLQ